MCGRRREGADRWMGWRDEVDQTMMSPSLAALERKAPFVEKASAEIAYRVDRVSGEVIRTRNGTHAIVPIGS